MNDNSPSYKRNRSSRCDGIGGIVVIQSPRDDPQPAGKGGRHRNRPSRNKELVSDPVDGPLLTQNKEGEGLRKNDMGGKIRKGRPALSLVKGTLRLTSEDLVVYLRKAGKGKTLMEETGQGSSSQRVETMVATGHVIIRTPRRTAYAGRAVYVESAHLFVLTEDPVVIQNGDRMSGARITFFTRMNKSVVQGHSLMLLDSHGTSSPPTSPKAPAPKDSGGRATDGH